MPRDSCNPCCNPTELSRGIEMYRSAVLQILCMIAGGIEELIPGNAPVEVNIQDLVAVDFNNQIVMPANPDRAEGSWIKNIRVVNVFIFLGATADPSLPSLVPPGETFFIPKNYLGDVAAITTQDETILEVVELQRT